MDDNRVKLEKELAELEALYPSNAVQQPIQSKTLSPNREALEKELAELEALYPSEPSGFSHRAGQFGRGFLSEIGAASDVPLYSGNIMAPYDENFNQQAAWLGRQPENPIVQMAEQLPESAGLGREYEPSEEDTLGKVLGFGGRMLAPTPILPMAGYGNVIAGAAKGAKAGAKALAKDIGMVGAQAAAIKGTPRLTEEGGIPGAIEDIAKGIGTSSGLSKSGKGLNILGQKALGVPGIKQLNRNESRVGNYLAKTIGEDNIEGVSQNLKNYKSDIGYEPLTGEIAGDPTFAQFQRAREGVVGTGIAQKQGLGAGTIVKALEGAELSKEDMTHVQNYIRDRLAGLEGNVEKELGSISNQLETPEAGRKIQKGVDEVLQEKKGVRRAVTKPLYEEVKKNLNPHEASNALNYLENEIVSGDVEKDFNYFKKQLMPKGITKKDIAFNKLHKNDKEVKLSNPWFENPLEAPKGSWIESVSEKTKVKKPTQTSVAQLAAVRKAINSRIQKYKRSGESERVVMLKELKNKLDLDMAGIKEHQAATAAYKELSPPVSAITGQKALNSVTKKLNGEFLMTESRVPDVFINSSAGSIDDARALLGQIKNKPEALEAMKSYLNKKASMSIIDADTGSVDVKKLAAFKDKYPGAKVLYPELYNVKLKDIGHAQVMVNRFLKNTGAVSDTLKRDALGELVGKDPKRIMKNLFNENSAENVENLVNELSKDKSGEKMGALRKETLKYFKKKITNAGAEGEHNVLSYPKMKEFMDSHENALKKVLTPEQVKVVKGIEKIVEGKNKAASQGTAKGSPTNANIVNALDLYQSGGAATGLIKQKLMTLGLGTPWVGEFLREWKTVQLRKNLEILDKAIVDHKYADFLLSTPLKSKQDALDFSAQMKKFSNKRYIPPELTALARKEQSNEKD
jgi:hypothetical protein